ncbi:exosome complex component RRP45-like, partial [Trifolium medium]|nr:exosome complex component RRP45-like [Trifolium medium]
LGKQKDSRRETLLEEAQKKVKIDSAPMDTILITAGQSNEGKTLHDAVKPKHKSKKKASVN